MSVSVNTNAGAMIALQTLKKTDEGLAATQKRISTGLRVADTYDDGAAYAVSSAMRCNIGVLGAVNERLSYAKGVIDVTVKAGEAFTGRMQQLGDVLVRLGDDNLTGEARGNYEAQFDSLMQEAIDFTKYANFYGTNIMGSTTTSPPTGSGSRTVLADATGNSVVIPAYPLEDDTYTLSFDDPAPAPGEPLASAVGNTTAESARELLSTQYTDVIKSLATAMNSWGNISRHVDNQLDFNSAMIDANTTGLGATIDADMAKESAALQSLQVKEQLGMQSLSMTTQGPKSILDLFHGS